jgi:excisionase family DNA binding protein
MTACSEPAHVNLMVDEHAIEAPMIAVPEAAEVLQCGEERIIELLKAGDLPGLKVGRGWVIPRRAFVQRINELALIEASVKRARRMPHAPAQSHTLNPQVGQKRRPGRPRIER